jgi:hypothetical protein
MANTWLNMNMNTDSFDSEEEELEELEDHIIQAVATAAIDAAILIINNIAMINYYNKLAIMPPPPVPTNTIPSSPFPSISAASSSKRKYSALDDDGPVLSGSHNSSGKKQKPHSHIAAINQLKASLDSLDSAIRDLSDERQLCRLQRVDPKAAQLFQASASSRQCRHEAVQRLQQTETYLDHDRMVALVDLVSVDTIAAGVYTSLKREDCRKVWISKRLKELGFIEGIAVDM